MTRLDQLRKEANRLSYDEEGEWADGHPLSAEFFSDAVLGDTARLSEPVVYHFTHQPCLVDFYESDRKPMPMNERTVACVMPNGPDNVIYHTVGECPRSDYLRDEPTEGVYDAVL